MGTKEIDLSSKECNTKQAAKIAFIKEKLEKNGAEVIVKVTKCNSCGQTKHVLTAIWPLGVTC